MTFTKPSPPSAALTPPSAGSGVVRASLAQWVPWALAAGCVVVVAVAAVLLGWGIALSVVAAVVLIAVVVPVVSRVVEGPRKSLDRLVTIVVSIAFALAMLPLISLVITVVTLGVARLDWQFLTENMRGVVGEGGGAFHAIVGTLLITAAAAAISVPVGIMCAIYLVEYGRGRLARAVTLLVDVMTGIPSIVAGLFAFALFSIFFGPAIRFGIGGAVALSLLMIPVVVRSVEEMLKLVPNELREASYALGVPKWRTIPRVVLRTAAAGIATGVTIAVARVIGETAPLLIIAGSTTSTNWNLFDGRINALPLFTYFSYTNPGAGDRAQFGLDRAWAAALTLFIIVMALNLVARIVSRIYSPSTGR
ncbi:MAG: phosphate ABC transporter permease PstA [Pseudonocardia sp.]|nr:phosphate ABC transporter permease PstA [Pseudonocardia sp.]